MEQYPLKNAVYVGHALLQPYILTARVLVDMTCGNGHDTAFLAGHMSPQATLYAFDLQAQAIEATRKRLAAENLWSPQIKLQQGSHDKLLEELQETADIILFNLGYLPSGDHSLCTKGEITIKAIKIGLHKIAKMGIIMIAAYPGTETGAAEAEAVRSFLQKLPQKEFDVSSWQPLNQIHFPPILYMIQKRG